MITSRSKRRSLLGLLAERGGSMLLEPYDKLEEWGGIAGYPLGEFESRVGVLSGARHPISRMENAIRNRFTR